MTKKRVAELYSFLSVASMKRLTDDEKVAFIKMLRLMKPTAKEMQEAIDDASAKAREDKVQNIVELVNKAIDDLSKESVDLIIKTMSQDTFDRLCLSNDWNFMQIDELQTELVLS